jgi:cell division protein FtsB
MLNIEYKEGIKQGRLIEIESQIADAEFNLKSLKQSKKTLEEQIEKLRAM